MKKNIVLYTLLILFNVACAQRVATTKISNSTLLYSVPEYPWMNYTWSTKGGSIIKKDKGTLRVSSQNEPQEVWVTETPIFKNNIIRVGSYGAVGNGRADDTQAIQQASNALLKLGGGTLQFDMNKTYVVSSVVIADGIHYQGANTTIKRLPNKGKWNITFRTDGKKTFKTESMPLKISGFIFDGNAQHQGAYKNYELQQAHLIFLACGMGSTDSKETGRLKVFIDNCKFINGVADGISQYINTDVTITNCEATNVFRGGYVCTGGNTIAKIKNFTTAGKNDNTGIDVEVDGVGFKHSLVTQIWMDNVVLKDGDFDVKMHNGSSMVVTNSKILHPPITIYMNKSRLVFDNCELNFGSKNSVDKANYILYPTELYFINCKINLERDPNGSCVGGALFIRSVNLIPEPMKVSIVNCNFTTSNYHTSKENRYGIVIFNDAQTLKNVKVYEHGNTFSADYKYPISIHNYRDGHFCDASHSDAKTSNMVRKEKEMYDSKVFLPFGRWVK